MKISKVKNSCHLLTLLILIFPLLIKGSPTTEKVALEDLYKPFRIRVDQERIFIGQEASIFIHSAKDYKLIKKFGKAGEGPQEFKLYPEFSPEIDVHSKFLLATSLGKISLYTKEGTFIKEQKFTSFGPQLYRSLGAGYVCNRLMLVDNLLYDAVQLVESDMKTTKIFHRHLFYMQRNKKYNPIIRGIYLPNFYIHDNRIYVGGKIDTGQILVYSIEGVLQGTIIPEIKGTPFTSRDKQGFIEFYMMNDEYKAEYERLKHLMQYPKFFPLYQNFIVADDKIYVQTFERDNKDKANQFYILDLKGKLLGEVWLPLVEYMDFTPAPYTIANSTLYQLAENHDTEIWSLHITIIEK